MKIATLITASVLMLPTLATHASDRGSDAHSVTVQFADLDLDRRAGIAKLHFRIQNAARRVCDAHAGDRLTAKTTYALCVDRAVATAVARIDRPALTDYVAKRAGKPAADSRVAVR